MNFTMTKLIAAIALALADTLDKVLVNGNQATSSAPNDSADGK